MELSEELSLAVPGLGAGWGYAPDSTRSREGAAVSLLLLGPVVFAGQ
jgi:hypothetical protein